MFHLFGSLFYSSETCLFVFYSSGTFLSFIKLMSLDDWFIIISPFFGIFIFTLLYSQENLLAIVTQGSSLWSHVIFSFSVLGFMSLLSLQFPFSFGGQSLLSFLGFNLSSLLTWGILLYHKILEFFFFIAVGPYLFNSLHLWIYGFRIYLWFFGPQTLYLSYLFFLS